MSAAGWFGQRLREMREKAGLTRAALAATAGVSERAVVQWERNEREPSWSKVLLICAALGVNCTAFTTEPTSDPSPRPRGRPPKAARPAQDERGVDGEAEPPSTPKKSARGKGRTRKDG